jgi:hypothetical protein
MATIIGGLSSASKAVVRAPSATNTGSAVTGYNPDTLQSGVNFVQASSRTLAKALAATAAQNTSKTGRLATKLPSVGDRTTSMPSSGGSSGGSGGGSNGGDMQNGNGYVPEGCPAIDDPGWNPDLNAAAAESAAASGSSAMLPIAVVGAILLAKLL